MKCRKNVSIFNILQNSPLLWNMKPSERCHILGGGMRDFRNFEILSILMMSSDGCRVIVNDTSVSNTLNGFGLA